MKILTKLITSIITTAILFVSCQNPAGGSSEDDPVNPPKTTKKEYTVTFDNNCPSMNGTIWYSCSDSAPSSIKAKKGESITLPAFGGELTKYVGSDEEGVYAFEKWNTATDGTGVSYTAGTSYQVNGNVTLYAVYSTEKNPDGNDEDPEDSVLDFSVTSTYSMKVGETVEVPSWIGDYSVYYEVQSGSDVIELGSGLLKAIGPGSATVNAIDWDNPSRKWTCRITVTADGYNGSALDYMLVGRWEDGNSYLVFNADKTGELKVYKNGKLLQESTFTWRAFEIDSYGKFLTLSNCSESYLEGKQFTIKTISATSLSLHGYFAFMAPEETSWTKR